MILLHRYSTTGNGQSTVEIAAVEEARFAEKYEAIGFSRCTPEAFRAAWRLRDQSGINSMRAALGLDPIELIPRSSNESALLRELMYGESNEVNGSDW